MGLSRLLCVAMVFLAGLGLAQPTPPTDSGNAPVNSYMGLNPASESGYDGMPKAAFQLNESMYQPLSVAPSDVAVSSRIGLIKGAGISESVWSGLSTEFAQASTAVGRSEIVPAGGLDELKGKDLQMVLIATENVESAKSDLSSLSALGLKAVPLVLGASGSGQEQAILLDASRQGAGVVQALSVVAPGGAEVQVVKGTGVSAEARFAGLTGAWKGEKPPAIFAVAPGDSAVQVADKLALANPKPSVLVVLDEALVSVVADAAAGSGAGCRVIAVGLSSECRTLLDSGKIAAWVRPDLRRLAVHASLVSRGLAPKGTVIDAEVLLPSQK